MYVYEGLLLAGVAFVAILGLLLRPSKNQRARSARIDRLLDDAADPKFQGGPVCWALLPSDPPAGDVCVRPQGHPGPLRSHHDDGGFREWFDSARRPVRRRRPTGRVDG